jgi:RNA polymerase sigma factor for flagellar operon FliA
MLPCPPPRFTLTWAFNGSSGSTGTRTLVPEVHHRATEAVQTMKNPQARGDLNTLWDRYGTSADEAAREQLILNYSPLVKFVAGRVATNLPHSVESADLISYGLFGLIDAIEKYEPERGIKFETYAIARIRGAIMDELRALETRLMRTPEDSEVAEELGITLKELHDSYSKLSYTSVVSFEDLWSTGGDRDDRPAAATVIEDKNADNPAEVFEVEEMKEILAGAIERLSERERTVIALYYYEGLSLKEIGQILGVTESRVSQMHTKAVLRLRARLHAAQGVLG